MSCDSIRKAEFVKYERAYNQPGGKYRMSPPRRGDVASALAALPYRGSVLDVGCGKQDLMDEAIRMGFDPVKGTEVVSYLIDNDKVVFATADKLPFADKSFDVVTFTDVIEHLVIGDEVLAIRELCRVARKAVFITANNARSFNYHGDDLHINKRPYSEWRDLMQWNSPQGSRVVSLPTLHQDAHKRKVRPTFNVSPLWRIDLP